MTTSETGTGIAGVTISGNGFTAEIAYEGATLLSWQPRLADGSRSENLVDGYLTPAELQSQSGVRNGILAPSPIVFRTASSVSVGRCTV